MPVWRLNIFEIFWNLKSRIHRILTGRILTGLCYFGKISFHSRKSLAGFYIQRFWYCSRRIYVGWNCQLTHSNKYIRFVCFESRGAPTTPLNWRTFLTTFVIQPWWSLLLQNCCQNTTFARILRSFIIFNTCSDRVHRKCTQRKSVIVMFCHIIHHNFCLRHRPLISSRTTQYGQPRFHFMGGHWYHTK